MWCPKWTTVAVGVEVGDGARGEVDALDAATDVPLGVERSGQQQLAQVDRREAAAVVAQVQRTVGTDGGTIGPADDLGDRLLRAVGVHTRDPRPEHLDQDDGAVGHRDGAFGETQSGRDLGELGHGGNCGSVTSPPTT